MNATVGCVSDLLVEIMRENIGDPLGRPGLFFGLFPNGESEIFIDATARLEFTSRFVGAVGIVLLNENQGHINILIYGEYGVWIKIP